MANKLETSSKNIKPRINLNHNIYKELMQCESVCDVKSVVNPLPFWLSRKQKMLGFSQVLEPIKWQDLLEEGKNERSANRCKDAF